MSVKKFWEWFGSILGAVGLTALGTKFATDEEFRKLTFENLLGVLWEIRAAIRSSGRGILGGTKWAWGNGYPIVKRIESRIRWALRLILFWPVVFFGLAMLPRDTALFYIPLAALVPVGAIAYLYTKRPLFTGIAMLVPKGRDLIEWSWRITAIATFMGIVLAALPLANDRTLIPLFFACLVVYFLPLEKTFIDPANGNRKQYTAMKRVVVIIMFILAVTFILGGRTATKQKLDKAADTVETGFMKTVSAATEDVSTFNPNMDCTDTLGQVNDLSEIPGSPQYFVMQGIPIGCWGKINILPDTFRTQGGCFQPYPTTDANPSWMVWFKFQLPNGTFVVRGPFKWDMGNAANRPVLSDMGVTFQLQAAPLPDGRKPGILFRHGTTNAAGYCI
ncbi:MAG TPA: hypothetical protein VHZ04_01720 [Candidatus Paceibacterota bacterium]|jgi:hypothetical protein|nr:hypothetical protein [Candidatus Paceibacterota bacterium]